MMDEFALADLSQLADFVITNSAAAMRAEIAKLPSGCYRHSIRIDGYERPVELHACVTVGVDEIHVDYTGSSECSAFGINVPLAYTTAYTAFGIRCLVGAGILNNAGSLSPVTVSAPSGCILNAPRPHAVAARQTVGQMLPELVFGCLHQAMRGAPAEGAGSLWSVPMFGGAGNVPGATGRAFTSMAILAGGTGARPALDGLSATAFPSRVRGIPIEIIETLAPVVFWKKELRPDSAGAGRFRGGLGQTIEIGSVDGQPFAVSIGTCERMRFAARGRDGGAAGACGRVGLASGEIFADKRRHVIPPGEILRLELPGGGGHGDASQRDPAAIHRDIRMGFVSPEAARHDYGDAVVIGMSGEQ
jgi:N-methylhydantoinase B